MDIPLDAGIMPPRGVEKPSRLAVYVGDPPRELLIFSGVALPEVEVDDGSEHVDVVVRLGAQTTENFTWTAQAALASISNDDSDFTLATDSASVEIDPVDGMLRLRVAVGVLGDDTTNLHRFSYTVHVLSDPIQAKISGHVSWPASYGDPTRFALQGHPMFKVSFGETVTVNTGGPFPELKFEEHGFGVSGRPVVSGGVWVAPYEIPGVPLGPTWEVRPALLGMTLNGPPSQFQADPGFTPNPQRVQLSLAHPSASGVDFTMSFSMGPR